MSDTVTVEPNGSRSVDLVKLMAKPAVQAQLRAIETIRAIEAIRRAQVYKPC